MDECRYLLGTHVCIYNDAGGCYGCCFEYDTAAACAAAELTGTTATVASGAGPASQRATKAAPDWTPAARVGLLLLLQLLLLMLLLP
jgi:hypothetical protein